MDTIVKDIGHSFNYIVVNDNDAHELPYALSPQKFMLLEMLPSNASILFYVDEELNACLEHYSIFKKAKPLISATFIHTRRYKSTWRAWINKLPLMLTLPKGTSNKKGQTLKVPLEIHQDRPRQGQLSAFTNERTPLGMLFKGTLANLPC